MLGKYHLDLTQAHPIHYIFYFLEKDVSKKEIESRPKNETTVQQKKPPPKTAATTPGPEVMPGTGQSLGGSVSSPSRSVRPQNSLGGQIPSTPDPEEVRRRRLAFLEKQNKKN